jgi:16S rRNA (guanine966-N2)-methyltransferase
MRVIAGTAKSLRLIAPRGVSIRPTSDSVRETLFNIVAGSVAEGPFLDLYAGCGSVGIEALSRGAPRCVFVERDRRCVQAILRNLENTGFGDRAEVVCGDARRATDRVIRQHGPFQTIFADPPYNDPDSAQVVLGILGAEALEPDGVLILQRSRHSEMPDLPDPDLTRAFGETELLLFSAPSQEH